MSRRNVLGRGMKALIQEAASPEGAGPYLQCPVEQIRANPSQPRKDFRDDSISTLANTIKERGVIQPLLVRRAGQGYEIIAGERRWRAAKLAGLKEVPVLVQEASDAESLEIALIENLHREDLNPIEQAEAYRQLIDQMGYTQEKLAQRLGMDRTTLTNTLRLLGLSPALRRMVAEGALSAGHARALLAIADPHEQLRLAREAARGGMPVREVERRVRGGRAAAAGERHGQAGAGASAEIRDIERRFREALLTRVRIVTAGPETGRIEIHYQNLDEFDRIAEKILSAAAR